MRRNLLPMLAAAVAAFALAPAAVAGDDPPNWHASAAGTTWNDGPVDRDAFAGTSSHLGRFTGAGSHVLDPMTFQVVGQATWTAADGSTLSVTYAGQVFLTGDPDYPFGAVTDLEVVGGTGRLANARGHAVLSAVFTGVPGDLIFTVEGILLPDGK